MTEMEAATGRLGAIRFVRYALAGYVAVSLAAYLGVFFVPPVYTFYVSDPQNWVALIAFESTALLVSRLSIQMEKQARTAILERRGMEKLYDLSRRTLLMNPRQLPRSQIVAQIRDVAQVDAVALSDAVRARVDTAGAASAELDSLARALSGSALSTRTDNPAKAR